MMDLKHQILFLLIDVGKSKLTCIRQVAYLTLTIKMLNASPSKDCNRSNTTTVKHLFDTTWRTYI